MSGGVFALKSIIASQLADWLVRNDTDGLDEFRSWARGIDPEDARLVLRSEGIGGVAATTIKYLAMLAGNVDQVKPDRHIRNFVACILGHRVSSEEATSVLREEAQRTGRTPIEVDHSVWLFQRAKRRRRN